MLATWSASRRCLARRLGSLACVQSPTPVELPGLRHELHSKDERQESMLFASPWPRPSTMSTMAGTGDLTLSGLPPAAQLLLIQRHPDLRARKSSSDPNVARPALPGPLLRKWRIPWHPCCELSLSQDERRGSSRRGSMPRPAAGSNGGYYPRMSTLAKPSDDFRKTVLYKGRWMVPIQVIVRLKVFQLTGVAAMAVPITTFLSQGTVEPLHVLVAISLMFGCGMASGTLWYFSRRYVGELALIERQNRQPQLCFSVLNFWGKREDTFVDVEALVPPFKDITPSDMARLAGQSLLPVDVEGDRQYIISLRQGLLKDPERLRQLLSGQPLTPTPAAG